MRYLFILMLSFFSVNLFSQAFTKLSVKPGFSISNQKINSSVYKSGGNKLGLAFTVEPTIFTFGKNKQFDFNADLSFIQKGGIHSSAIYSYDQWGQLAGVGSESYRVTLNYFSIAPSFKVNFFKVLFAKVGPRIDVLSGFSSKAKFTPDTRAKNDFNNTTYGITYGAGISVGKNNVKFIAEFIGQNDFSYSYYKAMGNHHFTNHSYIVQAGVLIILKNKN